MRTGLIGGPFLAGRDILLAHAEPACRRALALCLTQHGALRVREAKGCVDVRELLDQSPADFILIGSELPDEDVGALILELRRGGFLAPIVILGAGNAENDVIRGLDAGANDFVDLRGSTAILLARLRAHLRQADALGHIAVEVGPYRFHFRQRLLTVREGERRIPLTFIEAALLRFLHHNAGKPVDAQTIMRVVCGKREDLESHSVSTHIYRLRRKMEVDPVRPAIIVSVGGGYRIACASEIPATIRDLSLHRGRHREQSIDSALTEAHLTAARRTLDGLALAHP